MVEVNRIVELALLRKNLGWVIAVQQLQQQIDELKVQNSALFDLLAELTKPEPEPEPESEEALSVTVVEPESKEEEEAPPPSRFHLPTGANGRYCIAPLRGREGKGICGKPLTGEKRYFCSTAHAQRWRKDHPKEKPQPMFKPPVRTFVPGEGERE